MILAVRRLMIAASPGTGSENAVYEMASSPVGETSLMPSEASFFPAVLKRTLLPSWTKF
jgi:hypothetical protein